jgi:histidinol-phosphate aminotransferase
VTNLEDLPLRSDLRGLSPYGAPQLEVPIQLNVNENTHGIPESVALDIVTRTAEAVLKLNRYPDREFLELRQGFAQYLGHGLTSAQIWSANGSNEVLLHLFQAFGGPGRKALSFGPTYSMYPNIARTSITDYLELPRPADYVLSADYVSQSIAEQKPDIVILCTPNNPTGTGMALEVIAAAYEAFDGVLVVDEAYAEFSDQPSALSLLAGRPRLAISRTMSKAFAFAGARVGYLAADQSMIDALRLVRLPYHLSALTQAAASAALAHAPTMLATVSQIIEQRKRIEAQAASLGLTAHASEANFVLLAGISDPQAVFEALLERGVLIRNVGLPNTLRVTAGTEAETTRLLAELALVLS